MERKFISSCPEKGCSYKLPEYLPMPALAFTFGCSTDKLLRLRGFIELKKFHLNMEIILFTEILLREILL